jgi:hypothetical protein
MASDQVTVSCNETVYHFFPGDRTTVGHADLGVRNAGDSAATLEIVRVTFVEDGVTTPIDAFHVYSGETDVGQTVHLSAATSQTLRITFPAMNAGAAFRKYFIRMELLVDGRDRRVQECPIRVVMERNKS